jgi:uncharacterized protein
MPFFIDATDKPDSAALRAELRPGHIAFLEANQFRLIAAGAKLADDGTAPWGSIYILDVDDRQAAEAFAAADPYSAGGLFGTVTFTRWRKGFFDYQRVAPAPTDATQAARKQQP